MNTLIRLFLLILVTVLIFTESSLAQTQLPPCNGNYNGPCNGEYSDSTSGNRYVGAFRDKKFNGQGVFMLANGAKYDGNFIDGKFSGQGTLSYANGDKYSGQWVDGKRSGYGVFYHLAENQFLGNRFEGNYLNDKAEGYGKFIASSGLSYEGQFSDGKFSGQGKQSWPNGVVARSGVWVDGKNPDFSPAWVNSVKGDCKYFSNAPVINQTINWSGACPNGVANGFGRLQTYSSGKPVAIFDGNIVNGKLQGTVRAINLLTEDRVVTEYLDGKATGKGAIYFASGTKSGMKYLGEFVEGLFEGYGVFYKSDGQVAKAGLWKKGAFVSDADSGLISSVVEDVKNKEKSAQRYAEAKASTITKKDGPTDEAKQKCLRLGLPPGSDDFKLCLSAM
jgi:hypothetical protein